MKLSLLLFCFILLGCGVKGDPLPPIEPPHLGRGQPTFKEAVKGVQPVPIQKARQEEEKKEDHDE